MCQLAIRFAVCCMFVMAGCFVDMSPPQLKAHMLQGCPGRALIGIVVAASNF